MKKHKKTKQPTVEFIPEDQLSALTGLAPGELRTLARSGFFPRPRPAKGYPKILALTGCCRALQERLKRAGQMPVFDSVKECADITGIPVWLVQRLKKFGVDAGFEYNRIHLGPLLRKLLEIQEGKIVNWDDECKKQQALHRRLLREKLAGNLIKFSEVVAARKIAVLTFCAELRRIVQDMPPVLKGLEMQGIKDALEKHMDTIQPRITEAFQKMEEVASAKQKQAA